jgi:polyisoprenyl-phosphate glycosyltransferase
MENSWYSRILPLTHQIIPEPILLFTKGLTNFLRFLEYGKRLSNCINGRARPSTQQRKHRIGLFSPISFENWAALMVRCSSTLRQYQRKPVLTDTLEAPGRNSMRPSSFLLSVVVPCFNEQDVILLTYKKLVDVLGNRGFGLQIVFVDDGSNDGTADMAIDLSNGDPRVKAVLFSRNFGHQAAVSAGLANADGDAVVVMDADLQDPPEIVMQMIRKWLDGADVVYGIRTNRKERFFKRAGYKLFYKILQRLASIDAPADAGDFSLIDRKVLDVINQLPEKNRFFRGLRAWSGFRQAGVSYERQARAAGSTKYPLRKLIKLANDGIFNFSTAPLTGVFLVGITMSTVSFMVLVLVLVLRTLDIPIFGMRASDVQGFSSTILTILLIGGIQLVSTGVLGEYIGRIYNETKGRPSYVIREKVVRPAAELPPAQTHTVVVASGGSCSPE